MSYDPVDIIAAFASKQGLTYLILSDETGDVIASFGLLDARNGPSPYARMSETSHGYRRGIVHPGTFIIDEQGILVEKRLEASYRVRPTAVSILETSFAAPSSLPGVSAEAITPDLRIRISSGTTTYRKLQKLRLKLEMAIGEGLHVYAAPVPEGYTALTFDVDPLEEMEVGPLELPEPRPYRVEGLDEQFLVHEGTIAGALTVILGKNLGNIKLTVRVRYQACSEYVCFPPEEVVLSLPLHGLEHVEV